MASPSVTAKTLPAGVFTIAKAGVAYVRFAVDARMHSVVTVDGRLDSVQALSDGSVIDGVARNKGYYRYAFGANGATYGTLEGDDAPLPSLTGEGGLTLDTSGPQSFYVFPIQLAIDPDITRDHEALLELNVHESFRGKDQASPGFTAKVFDSGERSGWSPPIGRFASFATKPGDPEPPQRKRRRFWPVTNRTADSRGRHHAGVAPLAGAGDQFSSPARRSGRSSFRSAIAGAHSRGSYPGALGR